MLDQKMRKNKSFFEMKIQPEIVNNIQAFNIEAEIDIISNFQINQMQVIRLKNAPNKNEEGDQSSSSIG